MRRWLFGVLLGLIVVTGVSAQSPYSAVLRIMNTGVELRRLNTEAWLATRQNAEMPFGAGDVIRINNRGRALLTFWDDQGHSAEMMVLPYSTVEIMQFEVDAGTLRLQLRFAGQAGVQLGEGVRFAAFDIETDHGHVTQAAQHFAVQANDSATRVIVAVGAAEVTGAGQTVTVASGEGVRVRDTAIQSSTALTYPMNFAKLDSALDSCAGVANSTLYPSVNIRQGPGDGYDIIGEFINGDPVEILGTTPLGDRYRVRFLSAFGWVVANGIEATCPDLPVFPYETLEQVYGVIGFTDADLRLLEPFFGLRRDDYLFYPLPTN